jgi:phage-related protein
MKHTVEYFNARVKAEVESWPVGLLADYARILELLVDFGAEVRMPHSRAMGGGLFELRPRGREGDGRALYCFIRGNRIVILHAFIKTTATTPVRALKTARSRMKEASHD